MREKKSRRIRTRVLYAAIFCFGALLIARIALESALVQTILLAPLRRAVEAKLVHELSGRVSVESVSVRASGLGLRNVLVTPGVPSKGSQAATLRVGQAWLSFGWWDLLGTANLPLERIELAQVTVVLPAGGQQEAAPKLPAVIQAIVETGVEYVQVLDLELSAALADQSVLRLLGGNFKLERHNATLRLEGHAEALSFDGECLGKLSARATATTSLLQLESLTVKSPEGLARVHGSLDLAHAVPELTVSGVLELGVARLQQALVAFTGPLTIGTVVGAQRAEVSFQLSGPLLDPRRWLGRGRLELTEALARAPDFSAEVALHTLSVDAERTPSGLRFSNFQAKGDGLDARGELDLHETGKHRLSGTLRLRDLKSLQQLFHTLPVFQYLRNDPELDTKEIVVRIDVRGSEQGVQVNGHLESGNLRLRVAPTAAALALSHVETDFDYKLQQPPSLSLSGLVLQTEAGKLRGRGLVAGGRHQLHLTFSRLDAKALSGAIPGSLRNGQLSGRLTIEGDEATPVQRIRTELDLRKAVWRPPPGRLQTLGNVRLQRASGRVLFDGAEWQLRDVALEGSASGGHALGGSLELGQLRGRAVLGKGSHHLELEFESLDARRLTAARLGSVDKGTLRGFLTVDGDATTPLRRVSGTLALTNAVWRPPATARGPRTITVRHATAEVMRAGKTWKIRGLELEGTVQVPAGSDQTLAHLNGSLRGSAAFDGVNHQVELSLAHGTGSLLSTVSSGVIEGGTVGGSLLLEGHVEQPLRRLSGTLRLSRALLRLPQAVPGLARVGLDSASARVQLEGRQWKVFDIEAHTGMGTLRGRVEGSESGHHAVAQLEASSTRGLTALLPGITDSGQVHVSADIRGTSAAPLAEVRGHVALRNALWTPPSDADLCPVSVALRSATADYSWSAQVLRLSRLHVDSQLFQVRGGLLWRGGVGQLDAHLTTQQLSKTLSLFPALSGAMVGGRGSAQVQLIASSAGLSGSVEGRIANSVLKLPDIDEGEPTQHPVDAASFRYEFGPQWQRVREVSLRGPQLNGDVEALWFESGAVRGSGRLWLTPRYTEEVTKGGRWALRLLGYPIIDTAFRLSGSTQDVRMVAAIATGWRWQLLRMGVPDRLDAIARGQAPLLQIDNAATNQCL